MASLNKTENFKTTKVQLSVCIADGVATMSYQATRVDFFWGFICGTVVLAISLFHMCNISRSFLEKMQDFVLFICSLPFFAGGIILGWMRMTITVPMRPNNRTDNGIILQNFVFYSKEVAFPLDKELKVELHETRPQKAVRGFSVESVDGAFHAEVYQKMCMEDALTVKDFIEQQYWNRDI